MFIVWVEGLAIGRRDYPLNHSSSHLYLGAKVLCRLNHRLCWRKPGFCPLVWDKMVILRMLARCDLADNPLDVCGTVHVDTRADSVTDEAVDFHVGDQSMVDVVPLLCVHEEFHVRKPPVIAFWMLPWPVKDVGELDKGHATPECQWQHAPENEMISSYQINAFGLSSQRTIKRTETLQWSNGLGERNNNNICVVYQFIFIYIYIYIHICLPVVPRKAVAEVSKIGNL